MGLEEHQSRPHRRHSKTDLVTKVTSALHRLQKHPDVIRGFFHDPNLAYIAA
ncbi:hypothetical protein [Nocardia vaccinii]|uniref:hypothetical protein n=1 Tax=Nocardia vaccinii TaxID=1822 RepID=UPI000AF5D320|nr:hypothetical protein [Nocardia vaccinii]